jgi:hypothetical protein
MKNSQSEKKEFLRFFEICCTVQNLVKGYKIAKNGFFIH